MEDSSSHFRIFAKTLELALKKYEKFDKNDEASLVEFQRKQVDGLAQLEDEFRTTLLNHKQGPVVYKAFVRFIREVKQNILAARPYFRERQEVFAAGVSDALKASDAEALSVYHANFHFIRFAMRSMHWGKNSPLAKIARKIEEAREALIVMNLPLVVSRARIFWSRTPKSHLSFLDLVQIGVEGLISGVDKYGGAYTDNWCGVCIGRITGNHIDAYSQVMLHFYPSDKRKIYRANKFLSKHVKGDYDLEDVVKRVNDNAGEKQKTNEDELFHLIAAASIVSSDTKVPGEVENVPSNVNKFEAPEEGRPDVMVETNEAMSKMGLAIESLSLFDRKILRLKGVDLGTSLC
jgi:DNA-directed RNA polymerase specialized sigma subunit